MRKLLAILAVALVIPTMSFALGEGRYQIVNACQTGVPCVWVIDTKTGLLRFCGLDQSSLDPPACSPAKDTSK